jgi:metal transporter CNNM
MLYADICNMKGLLSLDITKLEIKSITGSEREKAAAIAVLPIVQQHHLLLVTLLLFNSLANETLPIFLGALVN